MGSHSAPMLWLLLAAIAAQLLRETSFLILPLLACAGLLCVWRWPALLERRIDRLEWAVLFWLFTWLLSAAFALHPAHAFALSMPALVFALLFALLYRGVNPLWFDTVLGALLLLASWQSATVLILAWDGGIPQDWIIVSGTPWLLVPNDAVWMLCLWPLWWSRARGRSARLGVICLSLLSLQAIAMLVLRSRLAILILIGLAVAVVASRVFRSDMPSRQRWLMVGGAAALSLAALMFALWLGKGSGTVQARWQLWQAAWAMWLQHPWLGVGPHGFGLEYQNFVLGTLVDPRHTPWPHQLLLELLANTGVIAVTAFSRVVLVAAAQLRRASARELPLRALGLSLLAFAAVSLLEASTLRLWWWVLLAVLLSGSAAITVQNKKS